MPTNWTSWMKWNFSLPKLSKEESENMNRWIIPSDTETVIKKLSRNRSPDRMAAQVNFTKHPEKNQYFSFSNYFIKFKRREGYQTHLHYLNSKTR